MVTGHDQSMSRAVIFIDYFGGTLMQTYVPYIPDIEMMDGICISSTYLTLPASSRIVSYVLYRIVSYGMVR